MIPKPPIFIELCAGTAALSLRLQGGPKAKPPVSRMGAKTGYADAILAVLGLYPGQGAESYLWCEPDDGVRGLLMAYPQPEVLRAAAKILRGWKDEEPRALWERLRAELKAGASVEGAEGVARFCTVTAWTHKGGDMYAGPDRPTTCHPPGWVASITASGLATRIANLPPLPPTFIARDGRAVTPEEVAKWMITTGWTLGDGAKCVAPGAAPGVKPAVTIEGMVERLRTSPTFPPVTVLADGRSVTPEEVAGWCVLGANAYRQGEPDSGYRDFAKAYAKGTRGPPPSNEALAGALGEVPPFPPVTIVADGRVVTPEEVARVVLSGVWSYKQMEPESGFVGPGARRQDTSAVAVAGLAEAEWPPVTLTADARTLTPPKLPPGVVCYMDPPYLDTTGYKHDLPRAEVVRMARLWADAGATVCISEAEPIPELMANGWHAVEISATRKGQKRTFSKQQAEWLTLSRPPSFVPRQTLDLFGAPA